MTVVVIGNDYTGFTAIGNSNSYILTEGSLLAHDGNAFNFASTFQQALVVHGAIVAELRGVTSASNSYSNQVTISAGGSIIAESEGVRMEGEYNGVVNHGSITSHDYTGVTLIGDYSSVVNTGSIVGATGIYMPGTGAFINNSGTIQSEFYAAVIIGDLAGQQSTLRNSGVISTGSIESSAVIGGIGNNTVVNSGSILGNVDLGIGNDLFDNRGGHVSGEVRGGDGDDTYIVDSAATQIVEIGNQGTDLVLSTVSYNLGANFENLELLGNDALTGWGNYLDNELIGNDVANVLRGMGGEDTIYGAGGDDLIYGGRGHDTIYSGNGDDRVYGGIDNDLLFGNDGNDNLLGEEGTDRLFGGDGNDSLLGGANNDNLNGDAGADTLEGGSGFDRLVGGAGDDELTGDFNADTFIFSGNFDNDTITDFDANNDFEKIQLSGVSSIVDFADLVANHMTQVGADVLIDAGGGNTITLLNVNIGDLDAVDFIF